MSRLSFKFENWATLAVGISILFFVARGNRVIAQATAGTIVGTVHDATGAVVPRATITATNNETGIPQSASSGAQGDYTITSLAPGSYKITANRRALRLLS
jgi:hypothetical protein